MYKNIIIIITSDRVTYAGGDRALKHNYSLEPITY